MAGCTAAGVSMICLLLIWYFFILYMGIAWYLVGIRTINEQKQYNERWGGLVKPPTLWVREGRSALIFGRFEKLFGVTLIVVLFFELLGLHQSTFGVFLFLVILLHLGIGAFLPVRQVSKTQTVNHSVDAEAQNSEEK